MDQKEIVEQILKANSIIIHDRLVPLTGGQVNFAFNADNRYVVRVGRDEDSRSRLSEEEAIFDKLKGTIPVPSIVASGEIENCSYQIQEFIPGQLLSRLWTSLTGPDREAIVKELVVYLKHVHSISFDQYGLQHSKRKFDKWSQFWHAQIEQLKSDLISIDTYIPSDLIDLSFHFFEENQKLLDEGRPVFVHGDFWPGNILITDGKVAGLLDFEFAIQAPVEYELLSLERFCLYPNDYEENGQYTSLDYGDFIFLLKKYYPYLFQIPNLRRRMDVYHIIRFLESHIGYIKRTKFSADKYFPVNPVAKITNFLYGEGARLF